MTIIIETPDTRAIERDYILNVVLGEFLGLDWQRLPANSQDTRITLNGHAGEIRMPDVFLTMPEDKWLRSESLPPQPLKIWDSDELSLPVTLIDKKLPVIYGDLYFLSAGQPVNLHSEPSTFYLPIDIFGSAFFMFTRYEEVVKEDRDEHERFPAWTSLALQEGFLERPIIDEYVEILWAVMKQLWPGLERKKRNYCVHLSHDVDSVLYGPFAAPLSLLKQMAGDVFKRKELDLAWRRMTAVLDAKRGFYEHDPYNTFDFIMRLSEKYGLKSAFYFMAGGDSPQDANYKIDMPWVKKLIQSIDDRGHKLGLHPSYKTYLDSEATSREFQALLSVAEECGIHQEKWGGRQHFLRWSAMATWRNWEEAGLFYDSTLTYAQHAGFRAGTCFEYPVFDIVSKRPLSLRERPLIVMEGALFNKKYMGLNYQESEKLIQKLSKACKLINGHFSLLWHNSNLSAKREKDLYLDQIKTITNPYI